MWKNITDSYKKNYIFSRGCFWGVEAYPKKIPGMLMQFSGYANSGTMDNGPIFPSTKLNSQMYSVIQLLLHNVLLGESLTYRYR